MGQLDWAASLEFASSKTASTQAPQANSNIRVTKAQENPKPEFRRHGPSLRPAPSWLPLGRKPPRLALRTSDLIRLSGFGLRICTSFSTGNREELYGVLLSCWSNC